MHQPLQSHIAYLEDKLQELFEAVASHGKSASRRKQFEAQIQLLNSALDHYRDAYEIESLFRTGKSNFTEYENTPPETPQPESYKRP